MILLMSIAAMINCPTSWLAILPFGISSNIIIPLFHQEKERKKEEIIKKKERKKTSFSNQTQKTESLDFIDDIFLDKTLSSTEKKRMLMIWKQEYLEEKEEEILKRKELT